MSDRPTVDVSIRIEAPAARVWQLATDIVLMGQWSPEYQGGEWLDGASGPTDRRNMHTTLAGLKAAAEQGS